MDSFKNAELRQFFLYFTNKDKCPVIRMSDERFMFEGF